MKQKTKHPAIISTSKVPGWDASKMARQVIKENRKIFRELSKL